jgi:hypothetical protein
MADADELGFELLPADDEGIEPDADIAAAVASALDDPTALVVEEGNDAPEPFGYTWAFDFEAGRMIRRGGEPARVSGFEALKQRCLMALYSARYAHPVFSEEFGIEDPQHGLGLTGDEAREAALDWREMIRDALLALEDVSDVVCTPTFDPLAGVIVIPDLTVTTNEEVELPFDDIRLDLNPEG